jgi:hypothetical protein
MINNNIYHKKYLKYKFKYLNLLNNYQYNDLKYGGGNIISSVKKNMAKINTTLKNKMNIPLNESEKAQILKDQETEIENAKLKDYDKIKSLAFKSKTIHNTHLELAKIIINKTLEQLYTIYCVVTRIKNMLSEDHSEIINLLNDSFECVIDKITQDSSLNNMGLLSDYKTQFETIFNTNKTDYENKKKQQQEEKYKKRHENITKKNE